MNDIQFHEFEREDNLRQERLDAIADKRTGDWLTHQYHASPSPNVVRAHQERLRAVVTLCAKAASKEILRRLPVVVKKRNLDATAISNVIAAELLKGLGLKQTEVKS